MTVNIKIWDLPEKTFIRVKNKYRKELFDTIVNVFSSASKLSRHLNLNDSTFHRYRYGLRFIPLKVIKRILYNLPKNERNKFFSLVEKEIEEFKIGEGRTKSIKYPKLPFKLTSQLARIIGHILGDGGIRRKCPTVHYSNGNKDLINSFVRDITETFGRVNIDKRNDRRKDVIQVNLPSTIGFILKMLIGEQSKEFKHVPDVIINSNKKLKAMFLQALFDDEGHVKITEHKIELQMANKNIVEKTKELLKEFDIKIGKVQERKYSNLKHSLEYRFNISGRKNLELFNKLIGFTHPKKKDALEKSIKNYIRFWQKSEETKKSIIDLLKTSDNLTIYQLAEYLNKRPAGRFRRYVQELEKQGLIKSVRDKHKLKIYQTDNNLTQVL